MFANMASLNNWRRMRGFSEPIQRGHKLSSDRVSKIHSFSALIAEKLEIPTT